MTIVTFFVYWALQKSKTARAAGCRGSRLPRPSTANLSRACGAQLPGGASSLEPTQGCLSLLPGEGIQGEEERIGNSTARGGRGWVTKKKEKRIGAKQAAFF